jgi:hypothetical protein
MVCRRYTITITERSVAGQRYATFSARSALLAVGTLIMLPVLLGFGAAWKATIEVRELSARNRALEIETANHRAASQALAEQTESLRSALSESDSDAPLARSSTRFDATTRGIAARSRTPPARTSLRASRRESDATEATAAIGATAAGGVGNAVHAAEQEALAETLARVDRMRALAEDADAPRMASQAYQAAAAVETEALQLSIAGHVADALELAMAADAKFRDAETEARAKAPRAERSGRLDTVTPMRASAGGSDAPAEPEVRAESGQRSEELAPDGNNAENTIDRVIAQYVTGLETRNLAAIKQVWPSLDPNQERAIQAEFQNARSVEASFAEPRITINGDTTTATGVRKYSLVTQDGQRLSRETTTTLTLRRSGAGWVIERVVHQQ